MQLADIPQEFNTQFSKLRRNVRRQLHTLVQMAESQGLPVPTSTSVKIATFYTLILFFSALVYMHVIQAIQLLPLQRLGLAGNQNCGKQNASVSLFAHTYTYNSIRNNNKMKKKEQKEVIDWKKTQENCS